MTITNNASFSVTNSATISASVVSTVLPAVSFGAGSGRGQLTHPTLGSYLYANRPTQIINFDGAPIILPDWLHSKTIGGGADTLWSANIRDCLITERWVFGTGEVGSTISHLRYLYTFCANPPDPSAASYVVWVPNYAAATTFNVALVGLRAGGQAYTLDMFLAAKGYAASPVELDIRIINQI